MPERWKASTAIIVNGKPIKAGATFTAPADAVAHAVAARLVEPVSPTGDTPAPSKRATRKAKK